MARRIAWARRPTLASAVCTRSSRVRSLPRAISGSPMWPLILPLMMELPVPPWLFRSWGL